MGDMSRPSIACVAARESAAVFVLERSHIELTGKDRATFLHNFCTNDIKSLMPGQGCEAFICNVKGRMLGHVTVFAEPESLWLETVAGAAPGLIAHLDRYLIREDVQLHDRSSEIAELHLVGPQANRIGTRPVGWFVDQSFVVVGKPDVVDGFRTRAITDRIALGTDADWQSLRIAAGFPLYGVDLTEDNLPQEAARTAKGISFTKGCYLGQEPIARLDAMGHTNRELRRLRWDGSSLPTTPTPLIDPETGEAVGTLTSCAASPDSPGCVGLGMIKTKWQRPGTVLQAELPGGAIDAVVQPISS